MTTNKVLQDRKARLEKQLNDRGISDYEIKYLPYLDFDEATFASPYEVGVRMIILYSCAYVAYHLDEMEKIAHWLRDEKLRPHVSPREKELFDGRIKGDEEIVRLPGDLSQLLLLHGN